MSQDSQKCPKCGRPSGYDDRKVYWGDSDLYLCGQCKGNLLSRFATFFGLGALSSDDVGLIIEFKDADKILNNIKRDYCMCISYIVADKELYLRTKTLPTSILEE